MPLPAATRAALGRDEEGIRKPQKRGSKQPPKLGAGMALQEPAQWAILEVKLLEERERPA
jgi:hypothetical protein